MMDGLFTGTGGGDALALAAGQLIGLWHALAKLDCLQRLIARSCVRAPVPRKQRSSTLCSALARASRLNVWKTKPISLFRMWASSSSFISDTSRELRKYLPLDGVSRHPIRFIIVDFPDPDGPIMATYSPR
jgi:hypothetical protein